MKKIFTLLFIYLTLPFASSYTLYAVNPPEKPTGNLPDINYVKKPWEAIASFIVSMIGYAAVLAVIAITVAGIMMILAVWQEEKFKKARKILTFAIVGFAISAWAYLIVQILTRLSL